MLDGVITNEAEQKLKEECRADERKKRVDTMEERNKFEAMKSRVANNRSARAAYLEQILAGSSHCKRALHWYWICVLTPVQLLVYQHREPPVSYTHLTLPTILRV